MSLMKSYVVFKVKVYLNHLHENQCLNNQYLVDRFVLKFKNSLVLGTLRTIKQ